VAECGTNAYPDGAVGKDMNASPGTAPEAGYTCGPIMDRSERVKECTVKPAATAEGGVCVEECTPGRAVGNWESACPSTAPEAGCVSGFTMLQSA